MSTTTIKTRAATWPLAGWVLLALLAAGGLLAWGLELSRGMADMGIGQQVVWGLYIAGFFTAAGAGAGLVLLAAAGEWRHWLSARQQAHLLVAGLVSFGLAGVLILMDLGSPLKAWRLMVSGQWASLMVWDFYLLLLGIVVTAIAWLSLRTDARPQPAGPVVAALLALIALGIVLVESGLLSSQAARPFWESGLTILSFLAGAAVAGLSLALLLLEGEPLHRARRWLVVALGISLVIVLADVLAGTLSGQPRASEAVRLLVAGLGSPFFWSYLVLGIAVPVYLLRRMPNNRLELGLAAGLAVVGVLLEKTQLLVVGQSQPWLPGPLGTYVPSAVEILGVAGMAGAAVLVYGLLVRLRQPAG